MTAIFWVIGGFLGLGSGLYARALVRQMRVVSSLEKELGRTVASLIEAGEGTAVEFKSSLRWDYALSRVNKELEVVFTKTVAGFLNHEGGNLLICVPRDRGEVPPARLRAAGRQAALFLANRKRYCGTEHQGGNGTHPPSLAQSLAGL